MQNEIVNYFGGKFAIPVIDRDSVVPAGGTNFMNGDRDLFLQIDSSNLESILSKMHAVADSIDVVQLDNWLSAHDVDVDSKLYAALDAFTQVYASQIGFVKYDYDADWNVINELEISKVHDVRKDMYKGGDSKLSALMGEGVAVCVETSALAQIFLQDRGFDSSFIGGSALWNKNHERASDHSYVHISSEGKEYIFDSNNPHKKLAGGSIRLFPRLMGVNNFKEKMETGNKLLVKANSLLSSSVAWYGAGDGFQLRPEYLVD